MTEGAIFVSFAKSTALRRFSNITLLKFSAKLDTAFIVYIKKLCGIILHLRNFQISLIIPLGGKQMNRILAVAILLGITGYSYAQPYVTNISPAGKNGILVEKCKIQMNQLTAKISDSSCNTSYVWLGGEGGKNNSEEGSNPNNNVITIK